MKPLTKTLLASATATIFALGAATAYAADPVFEDQGVESRTWVMPKSAVSDKSAVIRVDEALPDLIVPLNTDLELRTTEAANLNQSVRFDRNDDLRNFDLVEDSPVFIGAQGATEFDTLDAKRDSGAYPSSLNVDPLFTVAGAGLATSF